jgi:nicotinamide riboside kinase
MTNKSHEAYIINLSGGPGVGKSILASDVFSALKRKGFSCEISSEYIKRKIREQAQKVLQNQIYIFGKQQFQLFSMKDNVQVIVTDSPIFLSAVYDESNCPELKALILKEFKRYKNINYYIERDSDVPYEQEGRNQDLEGAQLIDDKVKRFMNNHDIEFNTIHGIGQESLNKIVEDITNCL